MTLITSHIHDDASCDFLLSLFGELLSVFLVSFPILSGSAMPPKSKRARQSLEAAAQGREALKKARLDLEPQSGETVPPPTASTSGEMHAEAAPMSVASSSSATEPMADPKEILQDFGRRMGSDPRPRRQEGPSHALMFDSGERTSIH